MVTILIDITETINKKIKEYMLENNMTNKPKAIEKYLEEALK